MTRSYVVPVHEGKTGTLSLQTGRLISGERVGLAFTSEASLLMTLGPSQRWIPLALSALKAMLAPLGVTCVRVDPRPIAELGMQRPSGERAADPISVGRAAPPVAVLGVRAQPSLCQFPGPVAVRAPANLGAVVEADGQGGTEWHLSPGVRRLRREPEHRKAAGRELDHDRRTGSQGRGNRVHG